MTKLEHGHMSPILTSIIITIYFENVHFFYDKLGLGCLPQMKSLHSPHIPEYCPSRLQTKQFHVILHTFCPSLPAPTLHPCHLHISTGRHQSSILLCSRYPNYLNLHHICTTLNTKNTLKILQWHSTPSSYHHTLCHLQTMPIFSLHYYTYILFIKSKLYNWNYIFLFVLTEARKDGKQTSCMLRLVLDM